MSTEISPPDGVGLPTFREATVDRIGGTVDIDDVRRHQRRVIRRRGEDDRRRPRRRGPDADGDCRGGPRAAGVVARDGGQAVAAGRDVGPGECVGTARIGADELRAGVEVDRGDRPVRVRGSGRDRDRRRRRERCARGGTGDRDRRRLVGRRADRDVDRARRHRRTPVVVGARGQRVVAGRRAGPRRGERAGRVGPNQRRAPVELDARDRAVGIARARLNVHGGGRRVAGAVGRRRDGDSRRQITGGIHRHAHRRAGGLAAVVARRRGHRVGARGHVRPVDRIGIRGVGLEARRPHVEIDPADRAAGVAGRGLDQNRRRRREGCTGGRADEGDRRRPRARSVDGHVDRGRGRRGAFVVVRHRGQRVGSGRCAGPRRGVRARRIGGDQRRAAVEVDAADRAIAVAGRGAERDRGRRGIRRARGRRGQRDRRRLIRAGRRRAHGDVGERGARQRAGQPAGDRQTDVNRSAHRHRVGADECPGRAVERFIRGQQVPFAHEPYPCRPLELRPL
jgi:hypothetical protein